MFDSDEQFGKSPHTDPRLGVEFLEEVVMAWNPFRAAFDSVKRRQMRKELLQLMKDRCKRKGDAIQFEDLDMANPADERAAIIAVLLEEVVKRDPSFSLVMFKGGPALVKTSDVDALDPVLQMQNSDFIIKTKDMK